MGKQKQEVRPEYGFTKEEVLRMERFSYRRDLLGVLLQEDTQYTVDEVEAGLEKFERRKVM